MNTFLENYILSTGMTFRQVAACCGFKSASTVFQHCRGMRTISAESAVKYKEGLGISLSSLRPDLWPPTSPSTPSEPEEVNHGLA